jgi:hypothetical protein
MERAQTITHSRYGLGTIIAIEGENVTVKFEMFGSKQFTTAQVEEMNKPKVAEQMVRRELSQSQLRKWNERTKEVKQSPYDEMLEDLIYWGSQRNKQTNECAEVAVKMLEVSTLGGFAADVAKTCLKFGKVSPKQAAIIAKAYINR